MWPTSKILEPIPFFYKDYEQSFPAPFLGLLFLKRSLPRTRRKR